MVLLDTHIKFCELVADGASLQEAYVGAFGTPTDCTPMDAASRMMGDKDLGPILRKTIGELKAKKIVEKPSTEKNVSDRLRGVEESAMKIVEDIMLKVRNEMSSVMLEKPGDVKALLDSANSLIKDIRVANGGVSDRSEHLVRELSEASTFLLNLEHIRTAGVPLENEVVAASKSKSTSSVH
jgi:hypothetical protein